MTFNKGQPSTGHHSCDTMSARDGRSLLRMHACLGGARCPVTTGTGDVLARELIKCEYAYMIIYVYVLVYTQAFMCMCMYAYTSLRSKHARSTATRTQQQRTSQSGHEALAGHKHS